MNDSTARRALTIPELVAIVIVIAIVVALSFPFITTGPRRRAKIIKDGTQIKQIHSAWAISAGEHNDDFPAPGLTRRRPTTIAGQAEFLPGFGAEAIELNTTANLHAMLIMQNYYTPEIAVGPTEPSPRVVVKEDYDWDAYDPAGGVFWDDSFAADLDGLSNVSYASTPIVGERRDRHWRNSYASAAPPVIANRGPRDGVDDGTSMTYRIHAPANAWRGNIAYHDNHVELLDTMTPPRLAFLRDGRAIPDNLFAQDQSGGDLTRGTDVFLAIVSGLELDPDDEDVITGWTLEWD